jgi:phosphatidylserine decarboxylase
MVATRWNAPIGITLIVITTLLWMAIAAFFRVPIRKIPKEEQVLVSPADGVVRDIEKITEHGIDLFQGQELLRIGIFLSVLDVHVNRAPCIFNVEYKKYKEGRFHDARSPDCVKENESLVIAGEGHAAGKCFPVAVRQVSGAIARRIVCEAKDGDRIEKGAIYGMIKFGSRTELFLPVESWMNAAVSIGDRVHAGTTIIARIEA